MTLNPATVTQSVHRQIRKMGAGGRLHGVRSRRARSQ